MTFDAQATVRQTEHLRHPRRRLAQRAPSRKLAAEDPRDFKSPLRTMRARYPAVGR
jgi:hypothetical protein